MSEPTRDEFDSAAREVAKTAPPGLSREAFYKLVDQAISAKQSLTAPVGTNKGPMVRSRTGQMYQHPTEPVTGDVVRGAVGALGAAVNPMTYVNTLRHPIDTVTGTIGNLITNPAQAAGAGMVGMGLPALLRVVSPAGAGAAAQTIAEDLPIVRKFKPAVQAYRDASTTPKPTGAPPRLVKGTSLTQSIQDALSEAQAGDSGIQTGNPQPAPTMTPAGKPSVTPTRYDELAGSKAAAEAKPAPPARKAPGSKSTKLADSNEGSDQLGKLQEAIYGGDDNVPTKGNGTYKPTPVGDAAAAPGTPAEGAQLADEITKLRRKYGADRIGRTVSPKTPEAGTGTVLRADASSAPSAMPDIAQEALLRDLKTGSTASPSKTLRALSQMLTEYKRNKGVANSPVAKELADLLKKHGFETE